jgi:hypothetical protein
LGTDNGYLVLKNGNTCNPMKKIKLETQSISSSSMFALFGKAASGGKQVKQGLRLNP